MRVGGIGTTMFQPYIYNTNAVNRASMHKISAISDDVTKSKVDFSSLTDNDLNENPLKRGETLDFAGVLEQQFALSRLNAARVMKPIEENQEVAENMPQNKVIDQYDGIVAPSEEMVGNQFYAAV